MTQPVSAASYRQAIDSSTAPMGSVDFTGALPGALPVIAREAVNSTSTLAGRPNTPYMYEIRQLEVPASFVEVYCHIGRVIKPREFVEARFEACDDLARSVSEFCKTLAFKDDLCEEVVLQRCHAGLLQTPEAVSVLEAAWVVHRAAELLQWEAPALPVDSSERQG